MCDDGDGHIPAHCHGDHCSPRTTHIHIRSPRSTHVHFRSLSHSHGLLLNPSRSQGHTTLRDTFASEDLLLGTTTPPDLRNTSRVTNMWMTRTCVRFGLGDDIDDHRRSKTFQTVLQRLANAKDGRHGSSGHTMTPFLGVKTWSICCRSSRGITTSPRDPCLWPASEHRRNFKSVVSTKEYRIRGWFKSICRRNQESMLRKFSTINTAPRKLCTRHTSLRQIMLSSRQHAKCRRARSRNWIFVVSVLLSLNRLSLVRL